MRSGADEAAESAGASAAWSTWVSEAVEAWAGAAAAGSAFDWLDSCGLGRGCRVLTLAGLGLASDRSASRSCETGEADEL